MLLNEQMSETRFAAILAILVGIVLVSVQRRDPKTLDRKRLAVGVGYAIVAFLALGFTFFALKFVVGELGAFLPVLLVRLMSAIILTGVVVLTPKARPRGTFPRYFVLIVVIGIVDTLGNITYNLGILGGAVSVVSTISGLFSAITVLLAFVVLKERLVVHQTVGLLAILVGVSIIAYVT
jgi:drug/metabolite transporter (DMT)-like permease